MDYERLHLYKPGQQEQWVWNANEFWRRAYRDRHSDLSKEVRETLEDVAQYCAAYPSDPRMHIVLPDNLIHYTAGRVEELLPVIVGIDAIARTGAAPNNVAMLSNWVSALHYSADPLVGAQCAWILRGTVEWLTQQKGEHPWDSAIVFMAAQMTQDYSTPEDAQSLALSAAMDANAERLTWRMMTVMGHTAAGPIWWKAINDVHGGSPDAPMPELPIAREVVTRKERADQAWWRFGHEMKATPQYAWARAWMGALICPSRDETFSTNGLL